MRLWEMPAEALLALQRPALLPLIGQTQITRPEEVLSVVVARVQREADGERRHQMVISLLALLAEEEWVQMVERLLEEDWLIDESPYLQRIREAGVLATRQRDILAVLEARFMLSAAVRQQVEQRLAHATDEPALLALLTMAARSTSLEEFLAALGES